MKPDILLKIKEEVKKQFDAGFLQVVKYSEWVANIVPVPKKDRKVQMCVDYKDLNKASLKDNFPLPHTTGYSLFSFMDGFSRYNLIKMHLEDMEKTTFVTMWEYFAIRERACTSLEEIVLEIEKIPDEAQSIKIYSSIEKLCCAFNLDNPKTETVHVVPHNLANLKIRSSKVHDGIDYFKWKNARWQILLSEFDIVYMNQKAIKWSAILDFLASRALENYEHLNFDFPNEDLMYVATTEEYPREGHPWKLNFDGASNAVGNGIGAILVSPKGDHYLFTSKLDFDCMNNMAEYEACIMGIRTAIEHKIKVLEVYGDSALVIYQLKVNKQEDVKPIQMSIYEAPTNCYNIEEEKERDDHPWYHDILRYVKNREHPNQATENDKRTLRRLAYDYVLDRGILYKRRKDQVLLRCVDAVKAKKILE
ncbi:RNA-directed DNA polymerase (Reverse transcriptase), Ribonuclease H [Gossypium australe]|uniref:RNA-directed DNA polymerase (Reverse transcriptase), Ribonuclease H n=1 Tax=Gossypium australe TaxID=47621 RepID=A0A5B6V0V7_9ROSI|nr:RNA-directed DNA polymerase (Reverse transcriptase), Ribonuclease H [Gossypium australe]